MTEMVKAKLNGEFEIILPKHRADRPQWYTEQGWEKKRLQSMHETTKPGDVVYYVGAEEGEMCALLQMWGADVAMFEPNPLVWSNIKAIWRANGLEDPLLAYAGFAGNVTTEQPPLILTPDWPLSADGPIISDHGFKNLSESDGSIPSIKIDDVVEQMEKPPTMITLDVEGADWEVLRGAEQTMRKYKPRIYLSLHPEFMYEIYKEYGFDLRNWIIAMGYKETLLDYQHEVHFLYEASND